MCLLGSGFLRGNLPPVLQNLKWKEKTIVELKGLSKPTKFKVQFSSKRFFKVAM